jgi:hypothetical protein
MRRNFAAIFCANALPLLLLGLTSCGDQPAAKQADLRQALAVACVVDGVLVPVAQPIVAGLGSGGATAANLDSLLVHPGVVAACQALGGIPAHVAPVATPAD